MICVLMCCVGMGTGSVCVRVGFRDPPKNTALEPPPEFLTRLMTRFSPRQKYVM